jgi:hypothetical protein
LSAVLCAGVLQPVTAAAADTIPNTAAWRGNTGFITGIGLTVLIPPQGDVGVGADFSARYGIPAGPLILAPGGMIGGYYLQGRFIAALMGTFRVTAPLGPLAPFVHGGVGPGLISNPSEGGAAWMGGGGLVVHLGGVVSVGLEVNYQALTGTDFGTWTLGPTLGLGN